METQDKTCTVTIHNVLGWTLDRTMLEAVMAKTAQYLPEARLIDVYPQQRDKTGVLQWLLRIHWWVQGDVFTLGAVQRSERAHVEFHS